ncbi:MAG: 23S rRNA (adenine(2503)-C(2))-methyltransferase RlmN [Dissulfurispiraceae bacterium]
MTKKNLKAVAPEQLKPLMLELGLPGFRADQAIHWIYEREAQSVSEITEFSKDLREKLAQRVYISNLTLLNRQVSDDGTEKFLFELEDGETIESVLIPDSNRLTLCISSQAGCVLGCRFCLTGKKGFRRNLRSHEIVDQILSVNRLIHASSDSPESCLAKDRRQNSVPSKITNIVFMGMGEPLSNFEQVVDALWRIVKLLRISPRRLTLSTAGITPQILELPQKAPMVNLAISLNATTDEARDYIMPINKKYPLTALLSACRRFPLPPRRRLTFEYVLLKGVNDTIGDAKRLISLLRGIPSKVNLIPLNPFERSEFQRPEDQNILKFQTVLSNEHVAAFIRQSRGRDILAACGQLQARS